MTGMSVLIIRKERNERTRERGRLDHGAAEGRIGRSRERERERDGEKEHRGLAAEMRQT